MTGFARFVAAASAVAAGGHQTLPLDSERAVAYLNSEFTGRGGGSGVYMRQLKHWELWCGGVCYKGRPDCRTSAEFFNHEVGIYQSQFVGEFMFAEYTGVVFNSEVAERELSRCYYIGDAGSWDRYNGGCGCSAEKADQKCSSPHSPYANVAPDGEFVDGDSPWATRCMCTSTSTQASQHTCFWRGPAYNTSRGLFGKSEASKMIEQYKNSGRPRNIVQWTEVILDSHLLEEILKVDPASALVAVYYDAPSFYDNKGTQAARTAERLVIAQGIQSSLQSKYGIQLPLVAVNRTALLTPATGPFYVHKAAAASPRSSRPGLVSVVV